MHSLSPYSILAFVISALFHLGLWTVITTYKTNEKPEPIEKITLQMAMFKKIIEPPVVKAKPISPVSPLQQIATRLAKPIKTRKPKLAKTKTTNVTVKKKKKKVAEKKYKKIAKKRVAHQPTIATAATPKPRRNIVQTKPQHPSSPANTVSKPSAKILTVARTSRQPLATQPTSNPQIEKRYAKSVQQKIEQHKKYPRRAKRMHRQGVVKVGFTLDKKGVISKLRIVQSSGVTSLDKATLKAVKKVGKFPAFPAGINKPLLSYVIPIAYRLN